MRGSISQTPHNATVREDMSTKTQPAKPAPTLPAALPAGIPARAGRGKKPAFEGTAASMTGVVVPVIPPGEKIGALDAVGLILAVQPAGTFVSRPQLAQIMLTMGVSETPIGALHTAGCQTGPQGEHDRGIVCAQGAASDGQRGYALDKAGSERAFIADLKADAQGVCLPWDAQSKRCRYIGRNGFPWEIVTPEARKLGVKGRDMSAYMPTPPAAKPAPKQPAKKKK